MKKLLIWTVLSAGLFSCSDDDSQDLSLFRNKIVENNQVLEFYDYNDLFTAPSTKNLKVRESKDIIVTTDTVVVYGCDRMVSVKKANVALNSVNALKFGLPAGIYVVEYLECYKDINIGDNLLFEMDSPKCGFKPGQDFSLGNEAISVTKERGWTEAKGGSGVLCTYVFHIISDVYGRKYNRYDPCAPSDIEWIYEFAEF